MAALKLDILWSPHFPDKFVTFGTDLRLYNLSVARGDSTNPNFDDGRIPKLLAVNSDSQYLKCVSWCPREDYDNLLAVGQANGRVLLTSFNPHQDPSKLIGKEFIPRHARQCNALSWNVVDSQLLAAGLEKYRTDCSLLIWDVHKSSSTYIGDTERKPIAGSYEANVFPARAVCEYGNSEIIHSVQWLANQSRTLIAGCNQKYLRIIDIRELSRQPTSTSTKAVYGLSLDPFNSNRVVSYYESQVFIWDIRNFEKPIVTVNDTGPIVKVAWCPTRSNLLSSLNKDSIHVKLYDIQNTGVGSDELEPTIVERRLPSYGHRPLVSFCWHPFYENNLYEVNCNSEVHSHTVCERITLNWSAASTLVWTQSKKVVNYFDQTGVNQNVFDDITVKIRQRILDGYGFEMRKNSEIVNNEPHLQYLWKLLEHEGKMRMSSRGPASLGVHGVIRGENSANGTTATRSECVCQLWTGLPNQHMPVKIYKSSDRDRALLLCGWSIDRDGVNTMLDRLEASDCYQRAAAIAVFNMKLVKAIQILQKGGQKIISQEGGGGVSLSIVALALSGYSEEKISLWREMCEKLRPQLQDPYIRSMFAFLTCDNDSFEDVLNEEGISIQDRVAFACIFLPDNKLADHLDRLTQRLIDLGSLDGLLLTGLGKEGVDLLQKYVDLSGDVQTASLVMLQAMPGDATTDSRVLHWVESYRILFDRWRLWHQRAQFDVMWHKSDAAWRPDHQVYISCHFCGKSISPLMQVMGRGRQFSKLGGAANKSKVSSCPGCRKPLPRCALCLIHMGSPAGTLAIKSSEDKLNEVREHKLGEFGEWFTWCQTCRHGGHANHIAAWFKDHSECPVTSCNCKCMTLDSLNRVESAGVLTTKPKAV